jgi:hypothetical protein
MYANDSDFANMYITHDKSVFGKSYRPNDYFFEEIKLCVSNSSMLELFICEAYGVD